VGTGCGGGSVGKEEEGDLILPEETTGFADDKSEDVGLGVAPSCRNRGEEGALALCDVLTEMVCEYTAEVEVVVIGEMLGAVVVVVVVIMAEEEVDCDVVVPSSLV